MNALFFPLLAAAIANHFAYDRSMPLSIQIVRTDIRANGIEVRDITFANLTGGRTEAWLIVPPTGAPLRRLARLRSPAPEQAPTQA